MQLKKLEMHGFKSFAGRTEVVFEKGVTGVVGPNGCGKSNIVDAIRWVLGTLSYKAVRGEEMMDVIFKGAPGAAPMGYAEVSLTLDNTDKTLDIGFDEVVITRRLHRDGEGEYLINRSPVRLKDIRDLLYGTGIGTDNYSIIEQGKIDRLVMANPRERRLVFDEAAGVSKYRARRHEAELRLEKVTQDLLRMQDVVGEVQRELRSVRAQAGRAIRFRELETEYRGKRMRILAHERDALGERLDEIRAARSAHEARLQELQTALGTKREERGRIEAELQALDRGQSEITAALASVESKEVYLRKAVEQGDRRIVELAGEEARAKRETDVHEARAREGEEQERRFRTEAQAARAGVLRLEEEIAEAQARVEEAQRECLRIEEGLERKRAEAVELAHKESQHRTEAARAGEEQSGLEGRRERIRERRLRGGEEHSDLLMKLYRLDDEIVAAQTSLADLQTSRERESRALEELKKDRAGLEGRWEDLRHVRESNVARRETLTDLEIQREGIEAGARAILQRHPSAVVGTVADVIDVDPAALTAVEQALGDRAGFVVCLDTFTALRAASEVRDIPGRTGVVSLEACRGMRAADEIRFDGVLGRASDFVRSAEEFRPLVDALLGTTLLVDGPETAQSLLSAGSAPGPVVTREGDCFEGPALLRVGKAGGAGLLSRKAELRRLEREIEETGALLARAEAQREENARRTRVAEEKLELIRQGIYERMVQLKDAETQREQIEGRRRFLEDEILAANAESEEVETRSAALEERLRMLEGLVSGAQELRRKIEGEIVSDVETSKRYRDTLIRLQEEATAARVRRGQEEEKASALEKRTAALETDLRYLREAVTSGREQLREIEARRSAVAEERKRNLDEAEGLASEAGDLRRRAEETGEERRGRAAAAEEGRRSVAAMEAESERCGTALQDLRVQESEQRLRGEHLAQRTREEFGIDLETVEAPEAGPEPLDGEALAAEVEELRRKIQSFGSVNVVALDQLKDLEGRETDLLGQQKDLSSTQEQLKDLIQKLNRESREQFEKILEEVRGHFSTIFRKLFGGGKADIVVEQEEGVDPMDQGLEILVKPPNKEVTTLRLLSGGERSLTAIALVMALFKANPSPFCVLDEADAALDESNVGKYAGLICEYSSETQFIVITHNQRTMASADVLYGVTMETPGISKRVKVDLRGDGNLDLVRKRASAPETAPQTQAEEGASTATAVLEPGNGEEPR